MKKTLSAIVASLLLTGCFHAFHEKMDGKGTVTLALQWEQAEDTGTPLHNLTYVIQGEQASFTKSYASPQEAASDLLQLPEGDYQILTLASMTEADGYLLEGLPATKAIFKPEPISVSLKERGSSPGQAWFGVSYATVKENTITPVQIQLQRLLTTLDLHFDNLPDGAQIKIGLNDIADKIVLTRPDRTSRFGIPGEGTGWLKEISTGSNNLFPSVSGKERVDMLMTITSPAGIPLAVQCDVPRMDVGKSYTLHLDYNTLRPYMFLDSASISPWENKWTVNGEILNPQD